MRGPPRPVTDGRSWAARAGVIPWYAGGGEAGFARTLTIDNTGGAEKTDWTVEVNLTAANFDFTQAQADGSDVRFLAGATELPYWIESWNAGAETAKLWVRVPSIPADDTTTLTMRHGGAITNASDIREAFAYGEDWSQSGLATHPTLGAATTVLTRTWESADPHTLSIVDMGADHVSGFRFWGYYSLTGYGAVALARSNDLTSWTKYQPSGVDGHIMTGSDLRWPSVIKVGDTLHMFVSDTGTAENTRISRYTSADGITFTRQETIVARDAGFAEQGNPNIFQDPQSGDFILSFMRKESATEPYVLGYRRSASITGLAAASTVDVAASPYVFAAPAMTYFDGAYWLYYEWLTTYGSTATIWKTAVLAAPSLAGPWRTATNCEIDNNDVACMFPHIIDGNLVVTYSKKTGSTWDLRVRSAAAEQGTDSLPYETVWPWTYDATPLLMQTTDGLNTAQLPKSASRYYARLGSQRFDNFVVRARIKRDGDYAYFCFRSTNAGAHYRQWLFTNSYELATTTGWASAATVVSAAGHSASWNAGFNTVEVQANGTSLVCRLNGTQVYSVTNATHSEGLLALEQTSNRSAIYDWLTVRPFDGVEPTVAVGAVA